MCPVPRDTDSCALVTTTQEASDWQQRAPPRRLHLLDGGLAPAPSSDFSASPVPRQSMATSDCKSAHDVGAMGATSGCSVWGRWAAHVLVHKHVAVNTSASFSSIISTSGARQGSHSWDLLVRHMSPKGGVQIGVVDGDIACYEPWLSPHNHGRIWYYSHSGALLCASDAVCNSGCELQQGDTITVALDLEWKQLPASPFSCEGASPVGERGGKGRVDFFKNGQHVGGMALKGWSGKSLLFAGVGLFGPGDSVEMVQRQTRCLQARDHRRQALQHSRAMSVDAQVSPPRLQTCALCRATHKRNPEIQWRMDAQAWALEISDNSDNQRWAALRANLSAAGTPKSHDAAGGLCYSCVCVRACVCACVTSRLFTEHLRVALLLGRCK